MEQIIHRNGHCNVLFKNERALQTVKDHAVIILSRTNLGELASNLVEYPCILLARLQHFMRACHIYYYTATVWLDYFTAIHFQKGLYNDPLMKILL